MWKALNACDIWFSANSKPQHQIHYHVYFTLLLKNIFINHFSLVFLWFKLSYFWKQPQPRFSIILLLEDINFARAYVADCLLPLSGDGALNHVVYFWILSSISWPLCTCLLLLSFLISVIYNVSYDCSLGWIVITTFLFFGGSLVVPTSS